MTEAIVLREVSDADVSDRATLHADFIEEKTGHGWILWGMNADMHHSPCVICGHIFTLADEDFFQDIWDGRCACNTEACVLVHLTA